MCSSLASRSTPPTPHLATSHFVSPAAEASATLLRSFASLLAGNASVDGADTTALLPTT